MGKAGRRMVASKRDWLLLAFRAGPVDRLDLLEALFLIDGERTIADIAGEVAEARGAPVDGFRTEFDPAVLRLYQLGFLELSDPA